MRVYPSSTLLLLLLPPLSLSSLPLLLSMSLLAGGLTTNLHCSGKAFNAFSAPTGQIHLAQWLIPHQQGRSDVRYAVSHWCFGRSLAYFGVLQVTPSIQHPGPALLFSSFWLRLLRLVHLHLLMIYLIGATVPVDDAPPHILTYTPMHSISHTHS